MHWPTVNKLFYWWNFPEHPLNLSADHKKKENVMSRRRLTFSNTLFTHFYSIFLSITVFFCVLNQFRKYFWYNNDFSAAILSVETLIFDMLAIAWYIKFFFYCIHLYCSNMFIHCVQLPPKSIKLFVENCNMMNCSLFIVYFRISAISLDWSQKEIWYHYCSALRLVSFHASSLLITHHFMEIISRCKKILQPFFPQHKITYTEKKSENVQFFEIAHIIYFVYICANKQSMSLMYQRFVYDGTTNKCIR